MERCPHMITKRAGDESYDYCELTERPSGRIQGCILMSGDKCEVWGEIQEEWRSDGEDDNSSG